MRLLSPGAPGGKLTSPRKGTKRVAGLAGRVFSSRRARAALIVNALSSLGNLLLTIAIARATGIDGFGQYAVASSVYVLTTGLIRAAVTEGILAQEYQSGNIRGGLGGASLLALILGICVTSIGLIFGLAYLTLLGLALHGLVVLDYVKLMNVALERPRAALEQEIWWTCLTVVWAVLLEMDRITPPLAFLGWALTGAGVGYVNALRYKYDLKPSWHLGSTSVRTSAAYAADFLAGSGTAQLTFNVLAGVSGPALVGALRGGGTLLSPVTLVGASARSLLIAWLAKARSLSPNRQLTSAFLASSLLVAIVAPAVSAIQFLPQELGHALLGETWDATSALMFPLGLEALLALLAGGAFAGHRAHQAGGRTLIIRLAVGAVRVVLVVGAGIRWGMTGAAWAMAAVALVSCCFWWLSYRSLVKKGEIDA